MILPVYKIYSLLNNSLRKRGITGTLSTFIYRLSLRYRFRKLDLWGKVEPSCLNGPHHVREHAERYEATNPAHFRKLLDGLEWDFRNSVFVDFGCGKGASLIYASGMKFKKVIGVEFCEDLVKTARKNMIRHYGEYRENSTFEIIHNDASLYAVPQDADCFYFFNPFDSSVMEKVIYNIIKSAADYPRDILLIYMNAMHSRIFNEFPFERIRFIPEMDPYYPGGAAVYLYRKEKQDYTNYPLFYNLGIKSSSDPEVM